MRIEMSQKSSDFSNILWQTGFIINMQLSEYKFYWMIIIEFSISALAVT